MSTFGSFTNTATHPTHAFDFTGGGGVPNEVASSFTMTEVGLITSLSVYVAGDTSTSTMQLVLWDGSTGALLANSASFTAIHGSHSTAGQQWETHNLVTPYLNLTPNRAFFIGFYHTTANSAIWSVTASGTFRQKTDNVSLGSFSGNASAGSAGFADGFLGAFATYTPQSVLAYNSSAAQWQQVIGVFAYNSSSATWVPVPGLAWNAANTDWEPA